MKQYAYVAAITFTVSRNTYETYSPCALLDYLERFGGDKDVESLCVTSGYTGEILLYIDFTEDNPYKTAIISEEFTLLFHGYRAIQEEAEYGAKETDLPW